MAETEESENIGGGLPLKRKAISWYRMHDPKLWHRISWIRTNFVKDEEAGVRKLDFYNIVTDHLGKMSYRDVWYLLKIAYPHVERVRRGRMYMYWGVRQASEDINNRVGSLASTEKPGKRIETDDHTNDKTSELFKVKVKMEPVDLCEASHELGRNLVNVEVAQNDMEIKVYTSFEDYKNSSDQEPITEEGMVESNNESHRQQEAPPRKKQRSGSPPRQIFASESFIKKDIVTDSPEEDLHEFTDAESSSEAMFTTEKEDIKGSTKEKEQLSRTSSLDAEMQEIMGQASGDLSMFLLEPDNINKICMPLIRNETKTTTKSGSPHSACLSSDGETCSPDAIEDDDQSYDQSKSDYCDPVIVSVASIATLPEQTSTDVTADTGAEQWVETKDICTQTERPERKLCSIHGTTLTTQPVLKLSATREGNISRSSPDVVISDASGELGEPSDKSRQSPKSYDFPEAVKMIMISSSYDPAVASSSTAAKSTTSTTTSSASSGVTWSLKGQRPILPKGPVLTQQNSPEEDVILRTPRTLRQASSTSQQYYAEDNNNNVTEQNQRLPKVSGNATRFARSPEKLPSESSPPTDTNAGASFLNVRTSVSPTGILAQALANKLSARPGLSRTELIKAIRATTGETATQERFDQMPSPNIAADALSSEPAPGSLLAEARYNSMVASHSSNTVNGSKQTLQSSLMDLPESSRSEAIRKILGEQELQRTSPLYSSLNDLRARVQCLSAELEKERTARMQLEVELRKTKAQLTQERRMNDNLAVMLMAKK